MREFLPPSRWVRLRQALAATVFLAASAAGGCAPAEPAEPAAGPVHDARTALARGDQSVLSLISVAMDGGTIWVPMGVVCYPARVAPARRVGRKMPDHETYTPYVTAYNRALVSDARYRFAANCKPR